MPNWCSNRLVVSGDEDQLETFLTRLGGEDVVSGKVPLQLLETFVPMPEILKGTVSGSGEETEPRNQLALQETGFLNWWEWQQKNWGVKWGDSSAHFTADPQDGPIEIAFDTPWGPPCEGIQRISEQFDKLTFVLGFSECGMCFVGAMRIANGELVNEVEAEYPEVPELDDEDESYEFHIEEVENVLLTCMSDV
jgi:Ferredoxin-like domain in Api92-like protein